MQVKLIVRVEEIRIEDDFVWLRVNDGTGRLQVVWYAFWETNDTRKEVGVTGMQWQRLENLYWIV